MRNLAAALFVLLLFACKPKPEAEIARLEAHLAPDYRVGAVDSLLAFYRQAVDAHPDDHAANLNTLTKGAALHFDQRQMGDEALRWLDEALAKHAAGQSLARPVALLARLWNAHNYRSNATSRMTEADVQTLRALLNKNRPWIDSALTLLENEMGSPVVNDARKATQFIEVSEGYAQLVADTDTSKAIHLTLIAAGLAKTIDKPDKALQLYYEVAEKHPAHPKAPTALFMMGHIYEDDMQDLERAKSAYETFLERYPNDPDYADDATNALKYLGKSPEELIREFEKRNQ